MAVLTNAGYILQYFFETLASRMTIRALAQNIFSGRFKIDLIEWKLNDESSFKNAA